MTDELVKRLRSANDESFVEALCGEAAARIEALTAERDRLRAKLADAAVALDAAGMELSDFANCLSREPWAAGLAYEAAIDARAALLEEACIAAHDAYEAAAHEAGWATNPQSRKPWAEVPEANKVAMRAGIGAAFALLNTPTEGQQ